MIEWQKKLKSIEQKSNMIEAFVRWIIETIHLKYTIDEHTLQLYLITKIIYNENICCENLQCQLNIQRNNQPRQHSEWIVFFCGLELMTMTIEYSDELCVHWHNIQMMRIRESSIVWWSTRQLKTNIFLIYFKNRQKSRRKSWIHNIHLSLSLKPFEFNHIHKLRLFSNLCKYDEDNQNVFQLILFKRDYRMKYCEHNHNDTTYTSRQIMDFYSLILDFMDSLY